MEIEFAVTIRAPRNPSRSSRLGFLQVRPMVVSDEVVDVGFRLIWRVLKPSWPPTWSLGNGVQTGIEDIVFVRARDFSAMKTPVIAEQLGSSSIAADRKSTARTC